MKNEPDQFKEWETRVEAGLNIKKQQITPSNVKSSKNKRNKLDNSVPVPVAGVRVNPAPVNPYHPIRQTPAGLTPTLVAASTGPAAVLANKRFHPDGAINLNYMPPVVGVVSGSVSITLLY
jgi:hypothetical protein